jgi:hypothetical protein
MCDGNNVYVARLDSINQAVWIAPQNGETVLVIARTMQMRIGFDGSEHALHLRLEACGGTAAACALPRQGCGVFGLGFAVQANASHRPSPAPGV